jgi:hypothetical protein
VEFGAIPGGIFLNATISERADVPADATIPARLLVPAPRCGPATISERSGTAVKGLTVAPCDAMTACCEIVPRV